MTPRFSVLMPTHDRPHLIGHAIRSVLAQTRADLELLVVGDGAVDGTAAVVQGFGDPRIRWFDLPKAAGFGYGNRNTALLAARGAIVAYAADDDIMLPDHLERLDAAFADPEVMFAYGQALWVSADGIMAPDLTNLRFADERARFLRGPNTIVPGAAAYRASAFARRDVWPEAAPAGGDWDVMRSLVNLHGPRSWVHIPVPLCVHFTAERHQARAPKPGRLRAFLALADTWPDYPAELRLGLVAAQPSLQARFFEVLDRNPDAFVASLRRASADLVGRLALDRIESLQSGNGADDATGRGAPGGPPTATPPPQAGRLTAHDAARDAGPAAMGRPASGHPPAMSRLAAALRRLWPARRDEAEGERDG